MDLAVAGMGRRASWSVAMRVCILVCLGAAATGIGANWGTQTSHPLPADRVVQLLKDNGFQKVKLFDADSASMKALKNSGLEVMVGIPNDMLATLASGLKFAERWVSENVSAYIDDGVLIRYVAVGNEPFLSSYNNSFIATTYPALWNVQQALVNARLGTRVKATIPLNADVYQSTTGVPSGGDFRSDIRDLMIKIVTFLSQNGAPFTVNIYPFISLYEDPDFPSAYAFFDGGGSVQDGGIKYTNVFAANHDTLVSALTRNGFGTLPIVVGEIGWPTDGDKYANTANAQRFNQGFMTWLLSEQGTPLRPGRMDAYLFSLIDEDMKSIQPGNFERHWGIFAYDGTHKYQLNLRPGGAQSGLVNVKGLNYLDKKWCVLKSSAALGAKDLPESITYACARADCTSLGYGSSCSNLDARGNVSYAFNSYYQVNDQADQACDFSGLATVTDHDPSTGSCKFIIMVDTFSSWARHNRVRPWLLLLPLLLLLPFSFV